MAVLGLIIGHYGRIWPHYWSLWPYLTHYWPYLTHYWPYLTNIDPLLAVFDQILTHVAPLHWPCGTTRYGTLPPTGTPPCHPPSVVPTACPTCLNDSSWQGRTTEGGPFLATLGCGTRGSPRTPLLLRNYPLMRPNGLFTRFCTVLRGPKRARCRISPLFDSEVPTSAGCGAASRKQPFPDARTRKF